MEENTPKVEPTVDPTQETKVEPNVDTPVEPSVEEPKQPTKQEILRELSKEVGLNLFEKEGLEKLKGLVDSQKTEQEKLQEQLELYKTKETEYETKLKNYEAKLKASELGIKSDFLEDALKLANNDPNKLADVIKKYPVFKTTGDISIGLQDPNNNAQPSGNSEVEEYIAKNYNKPEFQKYLKK